MSHFTTIQTQIRDLEALRDACGELGLGFTANAKCRGYAGVTRLQPSPESPTTRRRRRRLVTHDLQGHDKAAMVTCSPGFHGGQIFP